MGDDKLTIIFATCCIAICVALCVTVVLLISLAVVNKRNKRAGKSNTVERAPQRAESVENDSYSNFLTQLKKSSAEPISASVSIPVQPEEHREEERKTDTPPKAQSAHRYEKLERILTSGTDNRVARQYELTAEKAERSAKRLKAIAIVMFYITVGSLVSLAHSTYFLAKFSYFRYDEACIFCKHNAEDILEFGNLCTSLQTQSIIWCTISTIAMIVLRILAKSKQEKANDARAFAQLARKIEGG